MADGTPVTLPLIASPQTLTVVLGGSSFNLTLIYRDSAGTHSDALPSAWYLDIADSNNNYLACGIPLVTGCDLVSQYPDIGINGALVVQTSGDLGAVPTFSNLGTDSNVFYIPTV